MQCRTCGTEIADKAIVCYKCGAGTTDPVRKPVAIPQAGGRWPSLLTVVVPFVLALTFILLSERSDYPGTMTTAAALFAALGAGLLITRLARRR
jgi:hypothetical protein